MKSNPKTRIFDIIGEIVNLSQSDDNQVINATGMEMMTVKDYMIQAKYGEVEAILATLIFMGKR